MYRRPYESLDTYIPLPVRDVDKPFPYAYRRYILNWRRELFWQEELKEDK
jgi:hypothetical protein